MSSRGFFTIEEVTREESAGQRDPSLDMLRCIACFLVCALSAFWLAMPQRYGTLAGVGTEELSHMIVYYCILGTPAILFMMLTGALMLSPQHPVSMKRLWLVKIPKLAAAYILWCLIYELYRIYMMDPQPEITARFLVQMWFAEPGHLWYLPVCIVLYMLVPILRKIAESDNRRIFAYLCLMFACAMALNTLYLRQTAAEGLYMIPALEKAPIDVFCQALVWMLYGYILYHFRPGIGLRILIYLLGIAAAAGEFLFTMRNPEYAMDFLPSSPLSLFTIFAFFKNTAGFCFIISVFSEKRFSKAGAWLIGKCSRCTFMIYLLHWLILSALYDHQVLFGSGLTAWERIWIYAAIAFAAGILPSLLLQAVFRDRRQIS